MNKQITDTEQRDTMDESIPSSVTFTGETSVDASGLHQTLDAVASDFRVTGFKCAECGLAHMHDTNKHRASDTFDLSFDDASSHTTNPNCHCFLHEAKHRGEDMGVDPSRAAEIAESAPIPDSMAKRLESAFGAH
jgi:hypothetical protein